MGQKLVIDKEKQAAQFFSNKNQELEDKTISVSVIYSATYCGNIN